MEYDLYFMFISLFYHKYSQSFKPDHTLIFCTPCECFLNYFYIFIPVHTLIQMCLIWDMVTAFCYVSIERQLLHSEMNKWLLFPVKTISIWFLCNFPYLFNLNGYFGILGFLFCRSFSTVLLLADDMAFLSYFDLLNAFIFSDSNCQLPFFSVFCCIGSNGSILLEGHNCTCCANNGWWILGWVGLLFCHMFLVEE